MSRFHLESIIPRFRHLLVLACCAASAVACSAVGLELPNYGFFGFVPRPDARLLAPETVVEQVRRVRVADTTELHQGEFRVDTARAGGERIWIVSRQTVDADQRPIVDSAWLDGWSLRTLRTVRHNAAGTTRLRFNRRQVEAEFTPPGGRTQRRARLYEAEPWGEVAIDVVIATLPLNEGEGGQLPIVGGFGEELYWLTYQVLSRTTEPKATRGGGMVFAPVWLVEVMARGERTRLLIDGVDRTVLRRESLLSPTDRLVVVRGAEVPSLQTYPVERLAPSAPPTGSIRRGSPRQVVPTPLPPAAPPDTARQ